MESRWEGANFQRSYLCVIMMLEARDISSINNVHFLGELGASLVWLSQVSMTFQCLFSPSLPVISEQPQVMGTKYPTTGPGPYVPGLLFCRAWDLCCGPCSWLPFCRHWRKPILAKCLLIFHPKSPHLWVDFVSFLSKTLKWHSANVRPIELGPLVLLKPEGNPSMAALLKNLFQAGRIKTQTHPLAPDVHLARLTASLYLICCPVKRWTFEKLKCVRCIRELKNRTAGATTSGIAGEGSRSKNHWDQQINRTWDLQASEVNDTLKKKK